MFYGEHEHTIDDKKRLILPRSFRRLLEGAGVVLVRGIDKNVDVYPLESWRESVARIAALDSFQPEAREMKRHVFASAAVTALDAQGRVLLPHQLVQHAELERDVVVAGVHDHVEIWDRSKWEAHRSTIEGSVSDVAERLADKRV